MHNIILIFALFGAFTLGLVSFVPLLLLAQNLDKKFNTKKRQAQKDSSDMDAAVELCKDKLDAVVLDYSGTQA